MIKRAAVMVAAAAIVAAGLDAISVVTAMTVSAGCAVCAIASVPRFARARFAATALVIQAVLAAWVAVSAQLDNSTAFAAALVVELVIGGAVTLFVSALAITRASAWSWSGAIAWALAWGLDAAPLLWLVIWLLGRAPLGAIPEPGGLPAVIHLAGGIAIGATLLTEIKTRRRRPAIGALVSFGAAALLAAGFAWSLYRSTEPSSLASLRLARGLADAASSLSLAGLFALHTKEREDVQLAPARVA